MKIHFKFKILLSLILVTLGHQNIADAQNTPVSTGKVSATPVATPAAYTSPLTNLVKTYEPVMPVSDANAVMDNNRTISEVRQQTQFLDGLGRGIQIVQKNLSPKGNDMVSPIIYDSLGREQFKYLPYVQQSDNISDGKFKTNPFENQKLFYQNTNLNPGAAGENVYYGQVEFESSPLNRVLKTYKAGNSWAKEGGNHPIEMQYLFNTDKDSVVIWYDTTGIPLFGGYYPAGALAKNITIDEQGHQLVEFQDKEGQIVLQKRQLADAVPATAYFGWMSTCFTYDKMGRLASAIPPLAVDIVAGKWDVAKVMYELCYHYTYDSRNRMIDKKIPGVGPLLMVYDNRDRLVFSQDSIQRKKSPQEWLVAFYDGFNRPAMTALYTANTTRNALQSMMDTATISSSDIAYQFPATKDLAVYEDDGRKEYIATNSISFIDGFTSNETTEFYASVDAAATSGTTTITASNPYPGINTAALTPLVYNYYDDYSFSGSLAFVSSEVSKLQGGTNQNLEVVASSTMIRGFATGCKMRVLGTTQWLTSTTYYDEKGNIIQIVSDNVNGGKEILSNMYDFSGKLISYYYHQRNPASTLTPEIRMLSMNEYDDAGRLTTIKKRMNDDASTDRTISVNSFDELNHLYRKRLGITGTSTQLDTITYSYNLMGWVTGINKAFVNSTNATNWFGEQINYDNGFSTPLFTGNISGVVWKTNGNSIPRAYGYKYDAANRLTGADFNQQNTAGANWTADKVDFTVSNLKYDANGNILSMKQAGMIGNASSLIDQLTYRYKDSTNKLLAVTDVSKTATAKLGDFNDGNNGDNDDYTYDLNGNLKYDLNKAITSISYNFLNLPDTLRINGKGIITYLYDATGKKLSKTIIDSTSSPVKKVKYDYFAQGIYRQDTLQYLSHEEGRIRPLYDSTAVKYTFDYFEKDHLNNTRVILGNRSDSSVYTATMEDANLDKETALFSNIDNTRKLIPAGSPSDPTTSPNAYAARLNAENGQKIGPSIVLRVMAGDTMQAVAKSFYKSTTANTSVTDPTIMLTALAQAFSGFTLSDGAHGAAAGINSAVQSTSYNEDAYNTLKRRDANENLDNKPKAYLSYVLFDDQFNMVNENSGVKQVQGNPGELQTLSVGKFVVKKTGFIYIYTSNESAEDVYFDNLVVVHNSGPLLEETHYYPYGLTMAGISSAALKGKDYVENKLKYLGKELENKEFSDGNGTEWYDLEARKYDPQIGRFSSPDPHAERYTQISPYSYSNDNPVVFSDPSGKDVTITLDFNSDGDLTGITIEAVYYYQEPDENTMDADKQSDANDAKGAIEYATDYWNKQSGNFYYKYKDGDGNKKYAPIKFNLVAKPSSNPRHEVGADLKRDYKKPENEKGVRSNFFHVSDEADEGENGKAHAFDVSVLKSKVNEYQPSAHETGHSIGGDHTNSGVMLPMNDGSLGVSVATMERIFRAINNRDNSKSVNVTIDICSPNGMGLPKGDIITQDRYKKEMDRQNKAGH